jgi:hypothetical protein
MGELFYPQITKREPASTDGSTKEFFNLWIKMLSFLQHGRAESIARLAVSSF